MKDKQELSANWQDDIKEISNRLRDQDLISPEQASTFDTLVSEFGERLDKYGPSVAVPMVTTAFWAIELGRVQQQQAQAAGTMAWVRSAVPLDDEQRALLKRRLRARFGQEFVLHVEIDPSLIGGMVVRAKGKVFDGSVAGRLAALEDYMQEAAEAYTLPSLDAQGADKE